MTSQHGRDWAGRDLAAMLGIKPRNLLTQLAEWTRLGFLAKTGQGRYAPSRTDTQAGHSPAAPRSGLQKPSSTCSALAVGQPALTAAAPLGNDPPGGRMAPRRAGTSPESSGRRWTTLTATACRSPQRPPYR